MSAYGEALRGLNKAQRRAVETIEGPVLVIAGPGTGKTQLLGVRVAHILQQTDTLPQNILCLTFTESGADNMRERLTRFIGKAAYDVNIGTYHSFGADLIGRFPEVFAETRLQAPVDNLGKRQIIRDIVDGLTYDNPLKQAQHHLGDLMSTISEVKRALLDADGLRHIAAENAGYIIGANQAVQHVFDGIDKMPGTAAKSLPLFEQLLPVLQALVPTSPADARFGSLGHIAAEALAAAIEAAQATSKSTPLTAWKNAWLAKDPHNHFVFTGALETRRIEALANVFEQYQTVLAEHGWYDFDDMILRAIEAMEANPDLRYSLQEQYLYVLLDEFQDTNAAQLRIVQLLSDSPVSEGRPNVLAVGDDDQAIYAFQGAQYSNMLDFYHMYRDVLVVNLTENYRSSGEILATARNISTQITVRLETNFEGMSKELQAANTHLPAETDLERREFQSDVAQYDWMARDIQRLIATGTSPSDIAVLAPKHRQLEPLVVYLAALEVPMRYEKRENILEAPVIQQLLAMSRLVLAIHDQAEELSDALWPEVLSFAFWHVPTADLWKLSWQINDTRRDKQTAQQAHWSRMLLDADAPRLKQPALLMLNLANRIDTESCEQLLDYLIGTEAVTVEDEEAAIRSPLREFYTGQQVQHASPELFYDTISHLTVLRTKLREYAKTQEQTLTLRDLITFVDMYEAAEERMLNTSPYNQQADAVQLMTVFKAKGLEFAHVYLPSCQDDVWGSSSRGNSNKLTLPANLAPIRHAGATDDERLRILFVALTRAKIGLHLTSFTRTYSGKGIKHLKFFDEQEQEDGTFRSLVLPERAQLVQASDHQAPTLESLELHWRQRHIDAARAHDISEAESVDLRALLSERLKHYQLSPTHLTRFIDLEYGGPDSFLLTTLLCFPQAPSLNSLFGNAIHATLEWMQHQVTATQLLPTIGAATTFFAELLKREQLTPAQYAIEHDRGAKALSAYLTQHGSMFQPTDKAEHNFKNEGVFVGDAHLAGKVDRMEIDRTARVITVVDYKTGRPHARWSNSDAKLYKYSLQLYCYKLLIEGSRTYRGYTVNAGRLEFIEPDADGTIHAISLTFQDDELARVRELLQAMWRRVQILDLPGVSSYNNSLAGIRQFEADLLTNQDKPSNMA